jgi:glucose dehydrogenase
VNAPPITYAINGKQYVAVAAGGSSIWGFPSGDALVVFGLPD